MLLQFFNAVVCDSRRPVVNKEAVYNPTSADQPRDGARSWHANKCLDCRCYQCDVFLAAVYSVNILHYDVTDGVVQVVAELEGHDEGHEDTRDQHTTRRVREEELRDPVLRERLGHGYGLAIFNPGDDGTGRLVAEGNSAAFIAGRLAQSHDGILRGKIVYRKKARGNCGHGDFQRVLSWEGSCT